MIQIKVKDGTPISGKSLCITCKHSGIVKGQNGEISVHCNSGVFEYRMGHVPWKVAECSKFMPSNMPYRHEMEEMAWKIEARKRGPKGFEIPAGESEMEIIITKPKHGGNGDNPINWPEE